MKGEFDAVLSIISIHVVRYCIRISVSVSMYRLKSVGEIVDPCGTPLSMSATSARVGPILTLCCLFCGKEVNQLRTAPDRPIQSSRVYLRRLWLIVPNASIRRQNLFWSSDVCTSSRMFRMVASVLWSGLEPDWCLYKS